MSGTVTKDLSMLSEEEAKERFDLIKKHNSLFDEIDKIDNFIMHDTEFHYYTHSRQTLLKHKVVIMEIARGILFNYLNRNLKSI